MKFRKIFLLGSLTVFSNFYTANAIDLKKIIDSNFDFDSTYIRSFTDYFSFRAYGIQKAYGFNIKDTENSYEINYKPNGRFAWGFGFNYKKIGFGIALKVPSNDEDIYGRTNSFDIQLNIYGRKFIVDGYAQVYNGFYMANPQSLYANWEQNNFPYRDDITVSNIGISYYYVFNNQKFSYRSSFVFNERQMRSAGSFIIGEYVNFFRLNGNSSIVPDNLKSSFNESLHIKHTESFMAGVTFGYVYTLVIKKLFITAGLVPGLGYTQFNAYNDLGQQTEFDAHIGAKIQTRFSVGHSGRKTFWGLSAVQDVQGYNNQNKSDFSFNYGNFRLTFGYRFDASKVPIIKKIHTL